MLEPLCLRWTKHLPTPPITLASVVARFGKSAGDKLSNPAASGSPEDQLRGPFEELIQGVGRVLGFGPHEVVLVGETAMRDISSRPDYSVTRQGALIGFVELKAPRKGVLPKNFKADDKEQWKTTAIEAAGAPSKSRKQVEMTDFAQERRPPSPLGDIQQEFWLSEYTDDLLDLIRVLTLLVEAEPDQTALLGAICNGPTLPANQIVPPRQPRKMGRGRTKRPVDDRQIDILEP